MVHHSTAISQQKHVQEQQDHVPSNWERKKVAKAAEEKSQWNFPGISIDKFMIHLIGRLDRSSFIGIVGIEFEFEGKSQSSIKVQYENISIS